VAEKALSPGRLAIVREMECKISPLRGTPGELERAEKTRWWLAAWRLSEMR
jgi:hypothetical protein